MSMKQAMLYLSQLPSFILTGMSDTDVLWTRAGQGTELHTEGSTAGTPEKSALLWVHT